MSQYGVGNGNVQSDIVFNIPPPNRKINDIIVQQMLQLLYNNGTLVLKPGNINYASVHTPMNYLSYGPEGNLLCESECGYHSIMKLSDTTTLLYGVIPNIATPIGLWQVSSLR